MSDMLMVEDMFGRFFTLNRGAIRYVSSESRSGHEGDYYYLNVFCGSEYKDVFFMTDAKTQDEANEVMKEFFECLASPQRFFSFKKDEDIEEVS